MVLFLNGQMMHTLKSDGRLIQNSHSLFIGYDPVEYIEYFIGDMDDVRLYNRALSEKEVQELYKTEAEK